MSKDIEYRISRSKGSMATVTASNVDKVDEIKNNCSTLKTLIVIGKPDEARGEIVKTFITLAEGFEDSAELTK